MHHCPARIDSTVLFVLLSITRTFASGKTEKLVMQHLKDLGFASGKVKTENNRSRLSC